MKALVACPNSIILVDLITNTWNIVKEPAGQGNYKGEFYGISWDTKSNLCLTRSNFSHSALNTIQDYVNAERGYVTYGNRKTAPCLSGPHQLLYHKDKIICPTSSNIIYIPKDKSKEKKFLVTIEEWSKSNGIIINF